MKQVLAAKVKSCSEIKTALLKTENHILAEVVCGDNFWFPGLDTDFIDEHQKEVLARIIVRGKLLCERKNKAEELRKTEKKNLISQKTSRKNNGTDSESGYEY